MRRRVKVWKCDCKNMPMSVCVCLYLCLVTSFITASRDKHSAAMREMSRGTETNQKVRHQTETPLSDRLAYDAWSQLTGQLTMTHCLRE